MKPVTRRSVMAGSAAVVVALPALALVATEEPMERVKRLTEELIAAMTEAYGVPVHHWVDFEGSPETPQYARSRPTVWLIPLV